MNIIKGGLLTTVQDAGRRGYQRYGMGVSGAVDVHSYVYANLLVGNTHDEAVLEVTMLGPKIEITTDCVMAITGGDLSPVLTAGDGSFLDVSTGDSRQTVGERQKRRLNEAKSTVPFPMYQAVKVPKGSILSFGAMKTGCRAYIAVSGGLEIGKVMGSRSTYIKASLGGYEGRRLMDGDEIAFRNAAAWPKNIENRKMAPQTFNGHYTVRVLLGPQDDRFTEAGLQTFLNETYTVTDRFDRMGVRLAGPKIEHVTDGNIITDGIGFGAIQVPDDGQPIIMLADRQTTGGYAKIGSVINVDMPYIAQAKTGDTIRFEKTDIDTAQDLFVAQKEKYKQLQAQFDGIEDKHPLKPENVKEESAGSPSEPAAVSELVEAQSEPKSGSVNRYQVNVGKRVYLISIKEVE